MPIYNAKQGDDFSKESGTLIVPLKEQPPEGYEYDGWMIDDRTNKGLMQFSRPDMPEIATEYLIPLTYPVGSVINVRETWGYNYYPVHEHFSSHMKKEVLYKDDYTESFLNTNWSKIHWHSPVTMPNDAIRTMLTVESVEVKRVQDITYEEILDTRILTKTGSEDKLWENPDGEEHDAIMDDFANEFNSRFAKPKYCKANDSYECWLYEDWDVQGLNNYEQFGIKDGQYLWKNKPLTINVNSFFQIVKWSK